MKMSSSNIDSLLQELKIMGYIGHHVNIIQLIGCYTSKLASDGFAYVFVEYCSNGDLKDWLKSHSDKYVKVANDSKTSMFNELRKRVEKNRPLTSKLDFRLTKLDESLNVDFDSNNLPFNDSDLTFFAYQIAKGMEYLANKRFLHRDLAARNVLINQNFECKISDFGLADESKLASQAYFGRVNTGMPVKWTAPEALLDLHYEANSDVWSYGVVLWEIFSLCQSEPYKHVPNKEFREYLAKIRDGDEITELPENGSNEIHNIMESCWKIDHKIRPTFKELVPQIEALLTDNHKKYYALLTKNFQDQFTEMNKTFRRDPNLQRDSTKISQQPQSPTIITNQPSVSVSTMPSYIKTPLALNTNNNSDARYLQPQNTAVKINQPAQPGYLEPKNKPFIKNIPQIGQSGYLEPVNPIVEDSYGGNNYIANASLKQDTYINEDFISDLKNRKSPQFAEEEDDRVGDSYLIPRIGSNVSKASSTAPLLGKNKSGKSSFAPSPPLPGGKLSRFKSSETDV